MEAIGNYPLRMFGQILLEFYNRSRLQDHSVLSVLSDQTKEIWHQKREQLFEKMIGFCNQLEASQSFKEHVVLFQDQVLIHFPNAKPELLFCATFLIVSKYLGEYFFDEYLSIRAECITREAFTAEEILRLEVDLINQDAFNLVSLVQPCEIKAALLKSFITEDQLSLINDFEDFGNNLILYGLFRLRGSQTVFTISISVFIITLEFAEMKKELNDLLSFLKAWPSQAKTQIIQARKQLIEWGPTLTECPHYHESFKILSVRSIEDQMSVHRSELALV